MENASKALIIAGAILLAILIISLGIMIYNQAAGIAQNNSMNELEIQQFNQKFTQYEGSEIRGSSVRALQQVVNASNAKATTKVKATFPTTIENGKMYKVVCTDVGIGKADTSGNVTVAGAKDGLIDTITVEE